MLIAALKSRIINFKTAGIITGACAAYDLFLIHEFAESRDKIERLMVLMYRYINNYSL